MTATTSAQGIIARLTSLPPEDRELISRLVYLCSTASRPVQEHVTTMLRAPPEPTSIEDVRNRADAVIAYLAQRD